MPPPRAHPTKQCLLPDETHGDNANQWAEDRLQHTFEFHIRQTHSLTKGQKKIYKTTLDQQKER